MPTPRTFATNARRTIVVLALLFTAGLPKVVAQGDLDAAAVERGRTIYAATAGGVGCAACHGPFATGDVGPAIRGFGAADISAALDGVPDMEFITLTNAELDDLVAYLAFLGHSRPVMITIRDGELTPAEISVPAGTTVQLIITNADGDAYDLRSEGLGDHQLGARSVIDLMWTAPVEGGATDVEFAAGGTVAATLTITPTTD